MYETFDTYGICYITLKDFQFQSWKKYFWILYHFLYSYNIFRDTQPVLELDRTRADSHLFTVTKSAGCSREVKLRGQSSRESSGWRRAGLEIKKNKEERIKRRIYKRGNRMRIRSRGLRDSARSLARKPQHPILNQPATNQYIYIISISISQANRETFHVHPHWKSGWERWIFRHKHWWMLIFYCPLNVLNLFFLFLNIKTKWSWKVQFKLKRFFELLKKKILNFTL